MNQRRLAGRLIFFSYPSYRVAVVEIRQLSAILVFPSQLHMPLRENLTPIRVLRNLATQLAGSARSLGAVLVGYQGVRVFSPCALGTLLGSVADPTALLLSFLALSNTSTQLKNSLRAIFCVIEANHVTGAEVKRLHGYQVLFCLGDA